METQGGPMPSAQARKKYGILSGAAGIVVNGAIFGIEIVVGLTTHSIAITADAFHNLTDVITSVILIISFTLASRPADHEHPFGHGRIEYLATLLVSCIIMLIGFEFCKSSLPKIFHPSPVRFDMISLVLVLAAIPLKLFLSGFNRRMGRRIRSDTLKASSTDALSDVFTLMVASVSVIAAAFTTAPVDGWLGTLVSIFIMYSGFSIAKEAFNPLLGEPPDKDLVHGLTQDLMGFEYITGIHDLVIHNYGPGQLMASAHAEVPADIPVLELHESIDRAEKELSVKYGMTLVLHMDPLNKNDKEVMEARQILLKAIHSLPAIRSIHDFRVVGKGNHKNLVFDAVLDDKLVRNKRDEERLRAQVQAALWAAAPNYYAVISFDRDYTQV